MRRLAMLAVLVAAGGGCGSLDDDRPATLPYIQATIFAPTCAKAQCHSSFKQEVGDDYGTIDDTRITLLGYGLILPDPGEQVDGDNMGLYQSLTVGIEVPATGDFVRMPYDEPLPAEDLKLILKWLNTKNALGVGMAGGQCEPASNGLGCLDNSELVQCSPDGDILSLTPVQTCSNNQTCDYRTATCVAM